MQARGPPRAGWWTTPIAGTCRQLDSSIRAFPRRYRSPLVSGLTTEIVRELESRYGLTNCKPTPLTGGCDHRVTSWDVDCDCCRFVVRMDGGVSIDEARWLSDVERRVSHRRCAVPLLLAAKDGEIAFMIRNATVMVRPFVGQARDLASYGSSQLSAGGSMLAKIHGTDVRSLPARPGRVIEGELAEDDRDLRRLSDPELDAWRLAFAERADSKRSSAWLRKGLVHGDFFSENVRWNGARVTAIIDWGGTKLDFHVCELAFATWAFGQGDYSKLDEARPTAFLAGYRQERGPWQPELEEALIPLMRASLRDYIREVVRDDAEYCAELQREFRRLRNQDPRPLFDP
jgi:Ser/Thr protein kinase RdoA (MazF antagonist)